MTYALIFLRTPSKIINISTQTNTNQSTKRLKHAIYTPHAGENNIKLIIFFIIISISPSVYLSCDLSSSQGRREGSYSRIKSLLTNKIRLKFDTIVRVWSAIFENGPLSPPRSFVFSLSWHLPLCILNGYSDDGALCSRANRHVQSLGCTSGDGGEYLKQWSKMQQLLCCCMEK